MRWTAILAILVISGAIGAAADFAFEEPIVLESEGSPIELDSPGYAAPCWADIDQDGKAELLVGQFSKGKIAVYEEESDLKFGKREWLKANRKVASISGVW